MHKATCHYFIGEQTKMEEEKEKPSKKCAYCDFYDRYYTKGLRRFERTKQGFCSEQKKIVGNDEGCECWRLSSHRNFTRKRVASRALFEMMMDLSAIRQIFQESQEEEKNQ